MSSQLGRQAGTAVVWRSIQLIGTKSIFLVRTLVLARLLLPEDFGLLAISLIAVDFLVSVTNLGMIPALVQRTEPDEQQYNTVWTIGVGRAMVIAAVVFMAAPAIATLFAEPRATDLIRVVAIRPILEATLSVKVAELTRNLQFQKLAFIYLPEALVNTIVSIVLAPYFGVWALIAGTLAGPPAMVIISYILAPHRPRLILNVAAARPLIRFGRWIFLTGLIAVVGSSMVQLVVSRKLGTTELGFYFLAAKLAFIPYEITTEVVGAVAFPLYSGLQANGQQVIRAFRAIFTGLAAFIIPLCTLLVALTPALVDNVLGPRWEAAIPLIRLLALVNIVGLLGDTTIPIFKGIGQPSKLAVIELAQSTLLITLMWVLITPLGIIGVALAWLAAVGSTQLLSGVFLQRLLFEPFHGIGKPVVMIMAVSIGGALAALLIARMIPDLPGFILAGIAGAVLIAMSLWFLDRWLAFGLRANIGRIFPQVETLFRLTGS